MKPRQLLLPALVIILFWLGKSAVFVRADESLVRNIQSGAYVYYFPVISNQLASSCSAAPLPPVDWDPRLGPGGLRLLEQVRIIPALVASCKQYWRVVVVKFEDYYESGNDHTIYVKVVDENGNRAQGQVLHVTGEWSGISEHPSEKPAGDLCNCNFDFPMFGDAYDVHIDGALPTDTMAGMIMPMKQHVNYRITFQRVWNPS